MPVTPDHPSRSKDRFVAIVREHRDGCLLCSESEVPEALPASAGRVFLPLCAKHRRWAMASRRERIGRQARRLKHFVLAWADHHNLDRDAARDWLGY